MSETIFNVDVFLEPADAVLNVEVFAAPADESLRVTVGNPVADWTLFSWWPQNWVREYPEPGRTRIPNGMKLYPLPGHVITPATTINKWELLDMQCSGGGGVLARPTSGITWPRVPNDGGQARAAINRPVSEA